MKHRRKNITEDQIRLALKTFETRGGLIRTIPLQEVPLRMSVGPQHAEFENLLEAVGLDFI